jgi:hypothetical protein
MNYSRLADARWLNSNELSISIGVEDQLPLNDHADVVYARLMPGATLKRHRHNRSIEGYEAFFFFAGAQIRVLLANGKDQEIIEEGPFHLTFHGEEIHGVMNLSADPLLFKVLCAPKHVDNEETIAELVIAQTE